jgi:hypothetical protein
MCEGRGVLGTIGTMVHLILVMAYSSPANALINLEWRPAAQTVQVGDEVGIGLYAVSDDPEMDQLMAAMDVIIAWDPTSMELLGVDCSGCPNWLFSGFMTDPFGLNEAIPPQDGDGLYTALAPLGVPIPATPDGTLVTTFRFRALAVTESMILDILESAGSPTGYTSVYDGTVPNMDVTGTLGSAEVTIVCQLCPGDLNGDEVVNLTDLALLLAHYGTTSGASPDEGDLDCDGDVDLSDLALLLSVYGTSCL